MPITQRVIATAAAHPNRLAIAGDDDRLTYAELVESGRRLITVIRQLDGAQQPTVAISVDSAFHTARIMGSLAGYRAVTAVIDPKWPLDHRVRVIGAAGIRIVISDDPQLPGALAQTGWQCRVISLADLRQLETDAVAAEPPSVRDDDEPFLLLFSSGTTSSPKAFLKTRAQYRANLAVSAAHLEPLPGVVTLAPGPLSYSLTLYAVIEVLGTGGSVHVADSFDAIDAGRRIGAEPISRVVAVPAIVQALSAAARRDPDRFSGLDLIVTGGANLPQSIRGDAAATMPRARLISYYGAAEIGFIGDSRGGDGTRVEIYDSIAVEVRDDAGRPLPDGEIGRLWVLAAAASDGYLPGTADVDLRGPDGWATVDDRARIVEGRLELLGRAGDIAITGGHKVALPEVERAFDDLPGLGAVCAVVLPDARLGQVVALTIEGGSPPKAELQAHARARLAPQFVPKRWVRLAELPRTVGGKIRRAETAALLKQGAGERL